jgi:hypothetical protein
MNPMGKFDKFKAKLRPARATTAPTWPRGRRPSTATSRKPCKPAR